MTEPAEYPTDLEERIVLADHHLRIRPLRRGEEDGIRELYTHLSPRTRYLRFFLSMPTLSENLVRVLTCVDYRRTLALVAEHDHGPGREIIGLGSFAAVDDRTAEVALVVRDDWQRHRVGTELASRVLLAAEARGFDRFIADVRADNVAIRRLLGKLGEIVSTKINGGTSEIAFVRRQRTQGD